MVTRRALLGAATAGAAALAGCGDDGAPRARAAEESGGDSSLADVALLNDALAAERRAGNPEHAAVVEREIARLRGRVQPLETGGPAGADAMIGLYVDMLAKLSEPRLRGVVAGLLAGWARERAQRRVRAGEEPAQEPFV